MGKNCDFRGAGFPTEYYSENARLRPHGFGWQERSHLTGLCGGQILPAPGGWLLLIVILEAFMTKVNLPEQSDTVVSLWSSGWASTRSGRQSVWHNVQRW